MRRMIGELLLCVGLCGLGAPVGADEALARYALTMKQYQLKPAGIWLTRLDFAFDPKDVRMADGAKIFDRPGLLGSYDSSNIQDHTEFYLSEYPYMSATMHYAGRRAGEIFSLGLDSGFSSAKITVEPAMFLGYTRTYQVARTTYMAMSAGGWLGGKVSQQRCIDPPTGRFFHCQTRLSWTDYREPVFNLSSHFDVVFTHTY